MRTRTIEPIHCYACNFYEYKERTGNPPDWTYDKRAYLYEELVELVEQVLPGREMSRSDIWRQNRLRSGTSYRMLSHVISDMVKHKLIVCTFVDRGGNCRRYALAKENA